MDSINKFNGRAKQYTEGRPAYAKDFIDKLYIEYGFDENSVIADVGSGTGKFAKQLLDKKSIVYCIEPNDEMRSVAERELGSYGNFHSVKGTADHTNTDSDFFDFVTAAQAFHWFDLIEFRKECSRILKKNGNVILIWNMRDVQAKINRECFDIFTKYCPDFKGFSGGVQYNDERINEFFNGNYELMEFDNNLFFNKDRFINRCLSSSYSLKPDALHFKEYIREIEEIFYSHSQNDTIVVPNKTIAYIGKVIGLTSEGEEQN
jgi:ubiquinone/menaquinone biosynthesis C-methylase UbiE